MQNADFQQRLQRIGATAPAPQAIAEPMQTNKSSPTASRRARVITSLIGMVLGGTAYFYLFLSAAAGFIETERAQQFALGGTGIALILAAVALAVGFIGIFLRGYALGRVPLYFLCSVILTYAAFRVFRINALEWETFVALLQ